MNFHRDLQFIDIQVEVLEINCAEIHWILVEADRWKLIKGTDCIFVTIDVTYCNTSASLAFNIHEVTFKRKAKPILKLKSILREMNAANIGLILFIDKE